MASEKNTFVLRLQQAMKARGCSQTTLADLIKMDKGNFSRVYNGKPKAPELTISQFSIICRHLNISADWLLGHSEHDLEQENHEWFKAYRSLPKSFQVGIIQTTAMILAEHLHEGPIPSVFADNSITAAVTKSKPLRKKV